MEENSKIVKLENIQNRIFTIRGLQMMIDKDLAELYQVETRVLNQAVKRNTKRFPQVFMFQLTKTEFENLISQNVISSFGHEGIRKMPFVFTEHGVAMLSVVLKSDVAIEIKKLKSSHDRFLIIDNKTVYHFGASLKDIGKKWFAFSRLNIDAMDIIEKL